MYRVGIIGCGEILIRHIESINKNEDFQLVSLCDIDDDKLNKAQRYYGGKIYKSYREMIDEGDLNFVVVATPNSLHFHQAKYALENGCDVLVEKPVSLNPKDISRLSELAEENNQKAYTVLQVRLNPTVLAIKDLLDNNFLGKLRGVSLIQRWQRPFSYFSGWRSEPLIGGGTLYECGIHYIDVMCNMFGKPRSSHTSVYNTKHHHTEIEDTIYSILDFGDFGGSLEVNVSSEPRNLECSISILGEKGYIKIGGKALDKIEEYGFLDEEMDKEFNSVLMRMPDSLGANSYGTHAGSCPNHPTLYSRLSEFEITESSDSIDLIDEIYNNANIKYYID